MLGVHARKRERERKYKGKEGNKSTRKKKMKNRKKATKRKVERKGGRAGTLALGEIYKSRITEREEGMKLESGSSLGIRMDEYLCVRVTGD